MAAAARQKSTSATSVLHGLGGSPVRLDRGTSWRSTGSGGSVAISLTAGVALAGPLGGWGPGVGLDGAGPPETGVPGGVACGGGIGWVVIVLQDYWAEGVRRLCASSARRAEPSAITESSKRQ